MSQKFFRFRTVQVELVEVPRGHKLLNKGQALDGKYYTRTVRRGDGAYLYWEWTAADKRRQVSRDDVMWLGLVYNPHKSAPPVPEVTPAPKGMPKELLESFIAKTNARHERQDERHYDGLCGCKSGPQYNCKAVKHGRVKREDFDRNNR